MAKKSQFVQNQMLFLMAIVLAFNASTGSVRSLPQKGPVPNDDANYWAQARCDIHSDRVSLEAIELANQLNLAPSLRHLEELRKQTQGYIGERPPLELREDLRDAKEEILEAIEQARLEIEFVQAEFSVEIAGHSEILQAYSESRDNRVNFTNTWSFRTNGALWALAEALDIPTYKYPRYSIPSGSIGILAGIVPSVFSILAVKESSGKHYERAPRPNMLAKMFDYPSSPRIAYPDSVLTYMRGIPPSSLKGKTRFDEISDRWLEDKNIHVFSDRNSRKQLDFITGSVQNRLTIQLVADRLTMLQQLSALISQMNRPLLELIMVVRGLKHFPIDN
jgi:hypothetical protein